VETFYVEPSHFAGDTLTLVGDEHRHLVRVLRAEAGDRIAVVDGAGGSYDAVITSIGRDTVRCAVERSVPRRNELPVAVTLGAALLKNPGRFDAIIEKATELGASRIIPLRTERVIGRASKAARWEGLALAAMKQCGRCVLPAIAPPAELDVLFEGAPAGAVKLIPHERAAQPIGEALSGHAGADIVVCIGPEGGFTEGEIGRAIAAGFVPVRLGIRRLRADTAAIAALSVVMLAVS
jgi:16S rRNA (uracil1498-N3)-methyltransferase